MLGDFGTPYVGIASDGKVLSNRPIMDDEAAAEAMTDNLLHLAHEHIASV